MPDHLIQRIIERDERALVELYNQYGAKVFGAALHVLQDHKLAEEAAQDTFLKVWNGANNWNVERGTVSAWIMTIARFTAIDILRRERKHTVYFGLPLEEFLVAIDEHPTSDSNGETSAALRALIDQLPPEQTQAIEMAFLKGMTHNAIAAYLNEPIGTIKSRIRNGMKTLKGMWMRENS